MGLVGANRAEFQSFYGIFANEGGCLGTHGLLLGSAPDASTSVETQTSSSLARRIQSLLDPVFSGISLILANSSRI